MAAAEQAKLSKMLEDCKNYDKDVRETGARDLCNEILKRSEPFEESLEKRICTAFIVHLEDKSVDVKSNAVRCIQKTSAKIREANLIMIVKKLAEMVVQGGEQTLDIYALAVKGIIHEIEEQSAARMIESIVPFITKGLKQGSEPVKEECLDIFSDIFRRFEGLLLRQQQIIAKEELTNLLNNLLASPNTSLRKRASYCMGAFAVILNAKQLKELCKLILARISSSSKPADTLTQVQCLSLMAKTVGSKLAPYLEDIVPTVQALMLKLNPDSSEDLNNELSEACLSSLEAIIKKCPKEITGRIEKIFKDSKYLIEYDPNFRYDDQDMQGEEEDAEDWGSDFDDDGADQFNDDDDTSWKVRRAAIRVVRAIVNTRPDFTKNIVMDHSMFFVDRFKERVDDVKCDLLELFQLMLSSSVETHAQTIDLDLKHAVSLKKTKSSAGALTDIAINIIDTLIRENKSKNLKVRIAVLSTMATLVHTQYSEVDKYFQKILPEMEAAFQETQSFEPILDSLKIMRRMFRACQPGQRMTFHKFVPQIEKLLIFSLNHDYSKVVSEGLRVSGSFLNTLKDESGAQLDLQFKGVVQSYYTAITAKLNKVDIDQEVKSCAIIAAATVVCACHNVLSSTEISNILKIFRDRLQSELTRDAALKALCVIASNDNKLVIKLDNLKDFLPQFFDLLKKTQRQLHLLTLECLSVFTERYPQEFASQENTIQTELTPLISENDLQKAALALRIASNASQISSQIILSAAKLAGSEQLQGSNLDWLYAFFKKASKLNTVKQDAVDILISQVKLTSQAAAACLAIIGKNSLSFVGLYQVFIDLMNHPNPNHVLVGTLCLGEFGKLADFSSKPQVLNQVTSLFGHQDEPVRQAASISLGNISIGNPDFYLQKVFGLVDNSQDKQKYLFLNTVREIIITNAKCLDKYLTRLLPLLESQSSHEEESIRSIVAESIGRLFIVYSEDMIDNVQNSLKDQNALKRSTYAKSFKYSGVAATSDMMLSLITEDLIRLIRDENLDVKKHAIEGLTTIVHNKQDAVRDFYDQIQSLALQETPEKSELIETVDLGPFKHKQDKGVPIRKAAFQLLEVMFDKEPERVDVTRFVEAVVNGLEDQFEECMILNLHILCKLTARAALVVSSKLDNIVTSFEKLFSKNLRLITSKNSSERATNIIRAVLRVVDQLNRTAEVEQNNKFHDFFKMSVLENAEAKQLYEKIAASTSNMQHAI